MRIRQMVESVSDKTLEIGLFGGSVEYSDGLHDYRESIWLARSVIRKVLDIEPRVLIGPSYLKNKNDWEGKLGTDVYFDTSKKRLHVYRAEQASEASDLTFPAIELPDVVSMIK